MIRSSLAPLALLMVVGCVPPPFEPLFSDAAARSLDPAQPIVGAWQGEWVSEDGHAAGPARLTVTVNASGTDTLNLELVGFPTSRAGEWFTAEASLDPQSRPVRTFNAKIPAIVYGDLCAAALGLQASVDGDSMRIDYWVNDAIQQVDAGHVDLRRAGRPTTQP